MELYYYDCWDSRHILSYWLGHFNLLSDPYVILNYYTFTPCYMQICQEHDKYADRIWKKDTSIGYNIFLHIITISIIYIDTTCDVNSDTSLFIRGETLMSKRDANIDDILFILIQMLLYCIDNANLSRYLKCNIGVLLLNGRGLKYSNFQIWRRNPRTRRYSMPSANLQSNSSQI